MTRPVDSTPTGSASAQEMVCACGAEVEIRDLQKGAFSARTPPFKVWVHKSYERNLSHAARDVRPRGRGA